MSKPTFYITTPIYYPSDKLHIGNTYSTVAADVAARYKRMRGFDVMFLTGTDEHGMKIEGKAKEAGVTPKAFVDNIVTAPGGIIDLWKLMNISYDRFIRTTDDYHEAAITRVFKALYERGAIYKGAYKGHYCTPCESFWTETQLVDGKCPDCGREVKYAEEEAYFFKLSEYTDRILKLYEEQPGFLEPKSRVNEMVNNFLKPGLDDLCVSRTTFTWGVPVDFDPGHVVYVWVDALFNYMTALGFENDRYDDMRFWPCDVHFVGKDIVRFHAIIWPAMLMALDLPLPKKVFGHGWLLIGGGKMSKSKGNVVDPVLLAPQFGVDALRYYLLREFPFGQDGDFTNDLLTARINSDLANDFGNLVSRTVAMVDKYFGGTIPDARVSGEFDAEILALIGETVPAYAAHMDAFAFQNALQAVMKLSSRANKYIDETAPWTLAKDEGKRARLAAVLANLLETIRVCAVLFTPFMPDTAVKIFAQIGAGDRTTWDSVASADASAPWTVQKGDTLFPRIVDEK
ncbi:MAG: methionine--tRNA ligase [Oscillospiraceae bacterium]|jgi:methionyl-tRNA synthetase|nr:methionine--tRNA ligase [Oscillospiraceae bacterium]